MSFFFFIKIFLDRLLTGRIFLFLNETFFIADEETKKRTFGNRDTISPTAYPAMGAYR